LEINLFAVSYSAFTTGAHMKNPIRIFLLAVVFWSVAASAEVLNAEHTGFTISNEVIIDASREDVWRAAIHEVGAWWNPDRTVSGDASRLRISAKPQGCFCEDFGNDTGVVHLVVTMVNPAVVLRLTGALGPLGLMGVSGNMTWEFEDANGGTRVKFTYAVGGYRAGGLDAISVPVDYVIGEALARMKAHIETGDAENAVIG
jgi:uncharacterized protein YndB with AHSA1/START domain